MEKRIVGKRGWTLFKMCFLLALAGIALSSLAIFVVFWCTNIFNDSIIAMLELKNGTDTFDMWEKPPVTALYRIRVFNYTNVAAFQDGREAKLRVEEVGPYVYRETLRRVNIQLNENGTLTYQEKRSYQWVGGSPEGEVIFVPNFPLLSVMAFVRDMPFFAQLPIMGVLASFQEDIFIKVTAGGFLWGYDSNIFDIGRSFMPSKVVNHEKFGMFAAKVGVSQDRITINTGSPGDLSQLGVVQRFNGLESRNVWSDTECDRIDGTDGTIFPPALIHDPNAALRIYTKDICRVVPLRFHGSSSAHGIPTLRYKPSADVFTATPSKNSCYCEWSAKGSEPESCPPAGIFNASSCHFGLPTLASFPHFYLADQIVINQIDGLKPQKELHESYIDIHPRLGLPIGGWTRGQLNTEVRKAVGMPFLGRVEDGQILPLFWAEMGVDELPEPILNILREAYFTASFVELAFQWGSLVLLSISSGSILWLLKRELF